MLPIEPRHLHVADYQVVGVPSREVQSRTEPLRLGNLRHEDAGARWAAFLQIIGAREKSPARALLIRDWGYRCRADARVSGTKPHAACRQTFSRGRADRKGARGTASESPRRTIDGGGIEKKVARNG